MPCPRKHQQRHTQRVMCKVVTLTRCIRCVRPSAQDMSHLRIPSRPATNRRTSRANPSNVYQSLPSPPTPAICTNASHPYQPRHVRQHLLPPPLPPPPIRKTRLHQLVSTEPISTNFLPSICSSPTPATSTSPCDLHRPLPPLPTRAASTKPCHLYHPLPSLHQPLRSPPRNHHCSHRSETNCRFRCSPG